MAYWKISLEASAEHNHAGDGADDHDDADADAPSNAPLLLS